MSFVDTNFVFVLKDGRKIPVVYPDRLGREYETPWQSYAGSREWNVDVFESLKDVGKFPHPRFIVGKWGTQYGQFEGVEHVIPFDLFSGVEPLSEEDAVVGQARLDAEQAAWKEQQANERPIKYAEFSALEARVKILEDMCKRYL